MHHSVKSQDYPFVEHVFADGGSADGTLEYIKSLESTPNYKVVLIESSRDRGVGDGLNIAFKRSSGEILCWLDADDRLEKGAFRNAAEAFLSDPDVYFIYGECNIIDDSGEKIGAFVIRDFDKWEWVNRWHYIVFAAMFFRREVIQDVGFVNNLGNDLDFYLRVSKKFRLVRVDNVFASWRLNSQGISLGSNSRQRKMRNRRAWEDWKIVVLNRGSLTSPRALTYVILLMNRVPAWLKRLLRRHFKSLRKVEYVIKRGVAVTKQESNYSFSKTFFRDLFGYMRSK